MIVLDPGASVPTEWAKSGEKLTTVMCWLPELTVEQLESQDAGLTLVWTRWLWWIRRRLILLVTVTPRSSMLHCLRSLVKWDVYCKCTDVKTVADFSAEISDFAEAVAVFLKTRLQSHRTVLGGHSVGALTRCV